MSHSASCLNCGHSYTGKYCSQCGQSAHEGRIDASYFLHDIPHSVFHIDKGFFYTLFALFARPGGMIKDFLEGKRVKYFRPFAYVILMSTISTLLTKWILSGMESVYRKHYPDAVIPHHESFFSHYFSLFIFLMIPVVSLVTYLFFKKNRYNFWEHCLVNTFLAAQLNIMQVLIYLVSFIFLLTAHKIINTDFFIPVFMSVFLYLYGSVFGFLMNKEYKTGRLILKLTLMNTLLFFVYTTGFQLAGIMKPWITQ